MAVMARKSTVEERLSHCEPCEHNKMGICKRCGCIIAAKTRLKGQRCPIGLWGPESQGIRDLLKD
jgi:hypothetical protein